MAQGKRDCEGRYEAIRQYLANREELRNWRVLDFGAQAGYFAKRLSEDFGARVTAVDSNRRAMDQLRRGRADGSRIRPIVAEMKPDDIRKLGHFDVVLALSVLHHQPRWQDYLKAFTDVGDIVFVEVSHPDEKLPRATAQGQAEQIFEAVAEAAHGAPLVETAGYDASQQRPLYVIDQTRRPEVYSNESPKVTERGDDRPVDWGAMPDTPQPDQEPPREETPRRTRKKRVQTDDGLSDAQHE